MNNRQRKKMLKSHGKYVNPKETWNLDYRIASYILPRLKLFKKVSITYPGRDEADTPEKWDEALDKMIQAFEYVIEEDDWWINNPEYNYTDGMKIRSEEHDDGMVHVVFDEEDLVKEVKKKHFAERVRRQEVIDEGLQLFAKYFQHLWW